MGRQLCTTIEICRPWHPWCRYIGPKGTPHPLKVVINTLVSGADEKVLRFLARKKVAGQVFDSRFGLLHPEGE